MMRELDVFNCPLDGVRLIEASAGTGKTWNICVLYLRLLLEQQRQVEDILVVTFTKAATAELRDRIRSRLAELGRALESENSGGGDPFIGRFMDSVISSGRVPLDEARQRSQLALQSFDAASIFTIHGFCQRALAETPFAASQPFSLDFTADDTALCHEVAVDFWRQQVSSADMDGGFAAFLLDADVGPDWLADQLGRRLQKQLSRILWPDFSICRQQVLPDLERSFAEAGRLWAREAQSLTGMLVDNLSQLHGGSYKEQSVRSGSEAWGRYFAGGNPLAAFDDKQGLFCAASLAGKTKKNCLTPQHNFFVLAERLLVQQQETLNSFKLRQLELLSLWLDQGPDELRRRKQERRLVSYDDLLTRLHGALCGGDMPWLAAALAKRYPCALIDEFQDTDPVQFGIFERLYAHENNGSLFVVGDPKQAIYSFRSADLNTYLAARDAADAQYTLSANQRSTSGLIRALNALFAANPKAFLLDGLDYQPVEVGEKPRQPFSDSSAPDAALVVWMLPDQNSGLLLKQEAQALSTQATAAEIARLLNDARQGRITIGGEPLKPADIAVVVRSHAQGSAVKQALTALGIGCVELAQTSVFETGQAEEMERVLRAIADPARAARIRGALATELMGLDGNGIETASSDEDLLAAWVQKFQGYRALWLEHGFGFMWRTLLRQEQTATRFLAGAADGERKLTNLLHLGELLQQATRVRPGIEGLLRFLAQSRSQQEAADEAAQLRLESDENLVQILTIHKAKGLEFPVVFCPFLFDGRGGGSGRGRAGIEYHQQGQAVVDFAVEEGQVRVAKEAAQLAEAAENVRLLYVALTRAVYRCYLVAGCYGTQTSGRPSFKESARSISNWLVAGAGVDFSAWQKGERDPEAIVAAWRRLAVSSAGSIVLTALPTAVGVALPPAIGVAESFVVRPATRLLYESWRLGSFSALNRSVREGDAASPDHDALPVERLASRGEAPPEIDMNDFLRFPHGPAAGECLHLALELTDFSDPATWGEAIRRALSERPPSAGDLPEGSLAAMLGSLYADLLTTPLGEGLRLETVPRDHCLTELEFCFPIAKLTAAALNLALSTHGYGQPKLSFPPLQGFMKGFIDLVFRYQGRYYLLDWKSNHLGYTASAYGPEAIAQAMHQHGYHLQYLIYAVALNRYLRLRLEGYDFNRHFGGCFYLFVRGIRPGWHNADGSPCGVFFHRPALACVEELDQVFSNSPDRL